MIPGWLFRVRDWLWALGPHVSWIIGLVLLADAWFNYGWTTALAERPRATLAFFGLVLLLEGRITVNERKRRKRLERSREHWRDSYEEIRDDWLQLVDEVSEA